ncbi:MAG: hypothetical protein JO356_12420 [Acidobacteria bacterium]|nr:hypothetical protein [Acidobacteriota bacterium]
MKSSPSNDPLVVLWKSAPKPDTQRVLQDFERLKQMHQQLMWIVVGCLCAATLLLIIAEMTGRIATHGFLSVIWIVDLAIGAAWYWRARCSRIDALTLDLVTLLKFMLEKAKRDLFLARCLYAGVPCGALIGALIAKLTRGLTASARAVYPVLHPMLTAAGVALLLIMVGAGFVLARSRRFQVRTLAEKLRAAEAGR